MTDLSTLFLGPLAGAECRRASRRGWVIWVRMLPAVAAGSVAFVALWAWWIGAMIDPAHQPYFELRTGLAAVEGLLVACGLILAPAVLAGSLAGEKERGSIGLLLTTRANSADVVLGRLAGRLSQVLMIELAVVPALLLFAALSGLGWSMTLTLLALPAAATLGGGGLALAASALSRRGRDALLLVYLIDVLFAIGPAVAPAGHGWLGAMSPFEPLESLTWGERTGPALATAAAWLVLGLASLTLASWRLRPACLAREDGARANRSGRRAGRVPTLDERRPMLWKELYIERVGTLGRAGRWIGWALVAWLGFASVALAALAAWGSLPGRENGWSDWAVWVFNGKMYGGSALPICLLLQAAIGLRAAVAISSERERGTWDALLTSPLDGSEIVRGKLWGSLHALRWLILAALVAWTLTASFGGLLLGEYTRLVVELATIGTFMAALGVRTSLRSATATRAMALTIGLWLAAYLLAKAIAAVVCIAVGAACLVGYLLAIQAGLATFQARPWFPMSFRLGSDLVFYGLYLVSTLLIVAETRLRFDRVAGRMTGGKAEVAVDRLIHGQPMAPVRLGQGKASPMVD